MKIELNNRETRLEELRPTIVIADVIDKARLRVAAPLRRHTSSSPHLSSLVATPLRRLECSFIKDNGRNRPDEDAKYNTEWSGYNDEWGHSFQCYV
jgi:hypothetical protein